MFGPVHESMIYALGLVALYYWLTTKKYEKIGLAYTVAFCVNMLFAEFFHEQSLISGSSVGIVYGTIDFLLMRILIRFSGDVGRPFAFIQGIAVLTHCGMQYTVYTGDMNAVYDNYENIILALNASVILLFFFDGVKNVWYRIRDWVMVDSVSRVRSSARVVHNNKSEEGEP